MTDYDTAHLQVCHKDIAYRVHKRAEFHCNEWHTYQFGRYFYVYLARLYAMLMICELELYPSKYMYD